MELDCGTPPIHQEVVATDGQANDWFGLSVEISGIATGARGAE